MSEQRNGCGFWFLVAVIVMIFIVNQYQANRINDLQRSNTILIKAVNDLQRRVIEIERRK